MADGDHDILEAMTVALVIVDIVGGDVAETVRACERDEPTAALGVAEGQVLL
jgi:hypothetical protein